MDEATVREKLVRGIDSVLSMPLLLRKLISDEDRAVLIACRTVVNTDDEVVGKIAAAVGPYNKHTGDHEMLHPYPESPTPAVQLLVDKLRGEDVPTIELGHAAWHFAGYAMKQFDPHPPIVLESVTDDSSKADFLEKYFLSPQEAGTVKETAIPWQLVVQLAIELFLRWWQNR